MESAAMAQNDRSRQITGRQVLIWFVAFFTVVIVTDVVFVRLAVKSFPGEQVEKSYYQGLNYNAVLEEKERQSDHGWRMQLVQTPQKTTGDVIKVRLVGADGAPVYSAKVSGEIIRPMTAEGRQALAFFVGPDGVYQAQPANLEPGVWDLYLKASGENVGEALLEAQTRIIVP